MAQGAVLALQKSNGGFDGVLIPRKEIEKEIDAGTALQLRALKGTDLNLFQSLRCEQTQDQFEGQIFLNSSNSARTQKARQVGRGRVGCVELRHRRDDA